MTAFSILLIGLLLGIKHATDADHLAAVATLVTRQGSFGQTLRQGVAWGVGHTLTLMAFAGVVLALGQAISPALEQALETGVGLMLVALGVDVLRRLRRERIHLHARPRGADVPPHVPAHRRRGESAHAPSAHRHTHPLLAGRWPLRALAVGMMHGLAGSAALVMLSLQSVPTVGLGLGYIALFGAGSMVGMALLSVVIALPLRLSAGYPARAHRALTGLVGAFSCVLGLSIVWQIAGPSGTAAAGYLRAWLGA